MTKVINLLAGPSAGKSTNAYVLTGLMKQKRMNVELATEAAKDEVWRYPGYAHLSLNNQIAIFSEQNTRLYSLIGQVDYIITDGCLLQGLIYIEGSHIKFQKYRSVWEECFRHFVIETFHQYDNINYYIERGDRQFIQNGRLHNEEESIQKDQETLKMLSNLNIRYKKVKSAEEIWNDLESAKLQT